MNHPAAYTHLESLLLFETVLKEGVDNAAWARISERLTNNAFIKGDETFDAARLKPDPLQNLFFRILQQELWGDGPGDGPGSRKRKLDGVPLPTLKDLAENVDKVPLIISRLWERYKAHKVKQIRDDEEQYDKIQMDLRVLEKNESERLKRLAAANQNGQQQQPQQQPALAPREVKATPPSTAGMSTSPATTSATPAGVKRGSVPNTPVVPPKPPASTIAPPSHLPAGTPAVRPTHPNQGANGTGSVLQAPQGVNQHPPRVLQAPPPAPNVPISPRPEVAKPKEGAAPQTAAAQAQGTLKWEKPYQPPGTVQPPARQAQSPAPPKAVTPQQYAQNQQQWQQQQHQQNQYYQQGQVTASQQASPPQSSQAKPVLVPPQNAGNAVPQIQPGPPRPTGTAPSPQPRPQSKTPVPPPHRPIQPQQPHAAQQPRPIASASPTPPTGTGGFAAPPQRWPHGHVPQAQGSRMSPSASPAPHAAQKDKPFTSPYGAQAPRPAIPEHMIRHAAAGTPTARRTSTVATAPATPIQLSPVSLVRGFGTKWAPQSTPSTPGPLNDEPASPAYEPVSPPQRPATLPRPTTLPTPLKLQDQATPRPMRRKRERMKKLRDASGTPMGEHRRRSESVASGADELSLDHPDTITKIKDEDGTPRYHEEVGDTTADESIHGRGSITTPGGVSRILKRKRQETPPEPPGPPTQVLWTRGFTKVSSSALDQISSHRDGNMFATAVRERDAPNYRQIVLQPQDITSIRSAIKQGNKAAVQAANSLPGGDPGTTSLWLPISEDLTPPKGIINSAQLERELVHMFCNAIMYNPDPDRGVGQRFLRRGQEDEEEVFGYRMDENGVVRNTQSMYLEVEKLLSDLRSAEKERTGPPPLSTPRPASVATPADDTAEEEDELAADGEVTSGTAKRRRTTMRT